jgi:hypothetical protein
MQFQHPAATGHVVQAVYILRDQGEVRLLNFQAHQRGMPGVRPGLMNRFPPPVVVV